MKQFTTGEQLYIKGGNKGDYCADEGNTIKCDRSSIGSWEKFKFNKNSDGTYSFKGGKDGKYCADEGNTIKCCLLYTSPSPRDRSLSRMPSSA